MFCRWHGTVLVLNNTRVAGHVGPGQGLEAFGKGSALQVAAPLALAFSITDMRSAKCEGPCASGVSCIMP